MNGNVDNATNKRSLPNDDEILRSLRQREPGIVNPFHSLLLHKKLSCRRSLLRLSYQKNAKLLVFYHVIGDLIFIVVPKRSGPYK